MTATGEPTFPALTSTTDDPNAATPDQNPEAEVDMDDHALVPYEGRTSLEETGYGHGV
ncbi:MAG TPA: hypothetical protein VD998_01110 [Verrucomicrobiae bacterium]|nr:hypothetical protein [Verrucomicrobiae bacterium]